MGRNWERQRQRDLIRDRGTEAAKDDAPFMLPLARRRPRRLPPSKAELRRQGAAAVAEWLARKSPNP